MIRSLKVLLFFLIIPYSCKDNEDVLERNDIGKWEVLTESNVPGIDEVLSLCVDSKGNVWVGTFWEGVSCYDGEKWETWNTSDGLIDPTIFAIEEDINGDMWFGTFMGFSIFDGSDFTNYEGSDGKVWLITDIKQASNGSMWIGTMGDGFFEVTSEGLYEYYDNEINEKNYINCIEEDKKGNIWIGTDAGAYKITPDYLQLYTERNGLYKNDVQAIIADSWGTIWFGYDSTEYLTRYYNNNFSSINLNNGFTNNISSFLEDSRMNIWIGTSGNGVIKYDGAIMESFFSGQGLAGNIVYCMTQDKQGNLWFGCFDAGISIYKP